MSDLSDTDLQTYGVGSRDFGGMSLDLSPSTDAAAGTGFDWSSFATAAVKGVADITTSVIKANQPSASPAAAPSAAGTKPQVVINVPFEKPQPAVSKRTDFPQLSLEPTAEQPKKDGTLEPTAEQPKKDRTLLYVAIGAGVGSVALITTAVVLSRRPRRSRGDR